MIGRPWTPEEDALMRRLHESGVPVDEWPRHFPERGRTAVVRHWHRLRNTRRRDRSTVPPTAGPAPESDEFKGETWKATRLARRRITTLDDLVTFCSIDLSEWEIVRWTCNKWEVGAKDERGRLRVSPLFQVRAELKRRTDLIDARDLIRSQIEDARDHAPEYPPILRDPYREGGYMLELSIPDAHLGKLAWGEECGLPYDLKIAVRLFEDAVADLLARVDDVPLDLITLVFGNDLVNVDNSHDTTFAGTQQQGDSRHAKLRREARRMLVRVIERCRAKAPVRAVFVPGNHDPDTVFGLGEAVECWFHRCGDVSVDNAATKRKYLEFGRVMLMWTHGNFEKHSNLPLIMASEQPEMWGRTRYREAHTGHYHQRKALNWVGIQEHNGTVVRILPSLCQPDAYHTDHGYIGNVRSAEAYLWHREDGLVNTFTHAVREQYALRDAA